MRPNDLALAYEITHARVLAPLAIPFRVVGFSNPDYHCLVRPDQGRSAEIAREMTVTGLS